MADKETIILDLQVDQGSAISELEKTKKSIIQLKQEQKELTDAYKKGNVTLEEYASESVRLESILKKQQSTYNNVQKSVTGVKTQLDKLIDSNKKISAEFANAAKNINVAGVSVGDLTTKIASFANPATAAVAIVGALGAAYARSTVGARDLTFAQNQLASATTIVTNEFAALFSSAEDGEGAVTGILNSLLNALGPAGIALAAQSKAVALAEEELEDLRRNEIIARGVINERLADNQELLTKIQDSQTEYNEKIHLTGEVISNLRKNEEDILVLKNQQLAAIDKQLAGDSTNEKLLDERALKLQEISAIVKDTERKVGGIQRLESNLKDTEDKRLDTIRKQNLSLSEQNKLEQDRAAFKKLEEEDAKRKAEREGGIGTRGLGPSGKLGKQELKFVKQTEEQKREEYQKSFELKRELDEEQLAATALYFESAATLAATAFGEGSALFKALAVGQTIINTYSAATAALAPPPIGAGPLLGPALAAVTIASGLANVARITGVAAAGGADFITNRPTMLLVGDNPGGRERVTVEPLSGKGKTKVFNGGIAMAGGGSLTVDGGAAKNSAVRETNQALLYANAIKSMPKPVVGWAEGKRVRDRVEFKEKVTRL